MQTALYLVPFATVIALITSQRVSLLTVGTAGLLVSVLVAWQAVEGMSPAAFLVLEGLRGAWIAWHAVAIILAGIFFYEVLRAARPDIFGAGTTDGVRADQRQVFQIAFLLGPFAESATGFGVGVIVAGAALLRLGVSGPPAVGLALYSQMLVPWGALAIGTRIGADLVGLDADVLGWHSAVLTAGLLPVYLGVFWLLCRRAGVAPTAGGMVEDGAWCAALAGLLIAVSHFAAVEIVALAACGTLSALHAGRQGLLRGSSRPSLLRAAAPYAALTGCLVATRTVPPLREALQEAATIAPFPDLSPFPPFYHAATWLLVVAVAYGATMARGADWTAIVHAARLRAWRPAAITLVFVLMAQILTASGVMAELAARLQALLGAQALVASPVLGAVAGALTASNAASNSMVMPLQTSLAEGLGAPVVWIAAIQNVAGSNFTLVSPVRVAMACALFGFSGRERPVYAQLWSLAVLLILLLIAASAVIT